MGKDIKIFFIGVANSFRTDGYNRTVSFHVRSLGETSKKIGRQRQENIKLAYEKANEYSKNIATR